MRIIDSHCDLLSKMFENEQIDFLQNQSGVDVNYARLRKANMAMQFFAIYLPEKLKHPNFNHILEMIDLFQQRVLCQPDMIFIQSRTDLEKLNQTDKIGALLTLEGADGLEGNLYFLRIAHYLGVRCVGITWNRANWAADGVAEPRKGGFTALGKKFVKECNKIGMILDVSHLSETGFWELVQLSSKPFIASHSNTYEICPHPRNLSDEQIRTMIRIDGRIGLTFVPWFVKAKQPQISDILLHLDHICSLGGAKHIGFGSDFDGIDQWIPELTHTGEYDNLRNELLKHYSQEQVEDFLFRNWYTFLEKNLL